MNLRESVPEGLNLVARMGIGMEKSTLMMKERERGSSKCVYDSGCFTRHSS